MPPKKRTIALSAAVVLLIAFLGLLIAFSVVSPRNSGVIANITSASTGNLGTSSVTATFHPWATIVSNSQSSFPGSDAPGEMTYGAAQIFAPEENTRAIDCVAFIFKGPVVYNFALFDGYWVDTYRYKDDKDAEARFQIAIDYVKQHCVDAPLTILRFPDRILN